MIHVAVSDSGELVAVVRFDEASNSFSRFHPHLGRFGAPVQPGSHARFESSDVALLRRGTEVVGSGLTEPSVTLSLRCSSSPKRPDAPSRWR